MRDDLPSYTAQWLAGMRRWAKKTHTQTTEWLAGLGQWAKARWPWLLLAFGAILALVFYLNYIWTAWNFPAWSGFQGVTLWGVLQFISVPAFVAGAALWYDQRQKKHAEEVAEDGHREDALQKYLDTMTQLLLTGKLREPMAEADVRTVAKVRTLTVLHELDASRKQTVVRFLVESKLVFAEAAATEKAGPIISLSGADLSGADLTKAILTGADLREADLTKAILTLADLRRANLRRANLTDAHLFEAKLEGNLTDLSGAVLSKAKLRGAHLREANLIAAVLTGAILTGADLRDADLFGANLTRADLRRADLRRANLRRANLTDADLTKADLREAKNVAEKQLSTVKSLQGATMPDGTKHE